MKRIFLTILIGALTITPALAQTPDSFPEEPDEDSDSVLQFESQEEPNASPDEIDGDPFIEDIEPEIIDNQDLQAEFIQYTQDPRTKDVKFEIVLSSNITTDRVLLEWVVSGISVPISGQKLKGTLSVEKGGTLRIPITVKPTGFGLSEVFARIQVSNIDNQSIVTVRKNFGSNEKGQILPITDEFKQQQTEQTILTFVFGSIGIVVFIVVSLFGLKIFIKWLDRDDRDISA